MSNELRISYGVTGLSTITATMYLNGAVVHAGIVLTELAGQGGLYFANVPTSAEGDYYIQFFKGGVPIGSGNLSWNGITEITFTTLAGIDGGTVPATFTVTDSLANPLQNVTVTVWLNNSLIVTGLTDINGVFSCGLNAGTYIIVVNGISTFYSSTQLTGFVIVATPVTHTFVLSKIAITVSSIPFLTGYLIARSNSIPTSGISHTLEFLGLDDQAVGDSFTMSNVIVISDVNGLVQFGNIIPRGRYNIQVGAGAQKMFTAPSSGQIFAIADCYN